MGKPSETIQGFCGHLAILANKAYPLSSNEREKIGVTATYRGFNFESVKRAAHINSFNDLTIDEAVHLIANMENASHVFQLG